MTTLEFARAVVGGVDTHGECHVAAALDATGAVLGTQSFRVDVAGYARLLAWLRSFGELGLVGVEGTGSYGAGLTRFLADARVAVGDVGRPNRQARRHQGKSDAIDAVEAARAALAGRCGAPKAKDGPVESIRVLLVARRSATQARTKALVQMRHLVLTAPSEVRERLEGVSKVALVGTCARMRPGSDARDAATSTKLALRSLARRIERLDAERAELDVALDELSAQVAPRLRAMSGVGVVTAATLLVTAGSNPQRLRTEATFAHLCGVAPIEASSGKVTRHRLNRGGDRSANSALWRIVMVRMSSDPRTRRYVERRVKEGRSTREAMRCLKRYVAREVYTALTSA